MQFPKRIEQHVTESSSYKIFSNNIPDHWIIRDISERDYGIDCYIELVTNDKQVSGELISIQLKGTQKIEWNNDDTYTFSGIKITTTNYWNNFPVPVFVCLVDIESEEVFFLPVRLSIRKDYITYAKQKNFSFKFNRVNKLIKTSLNEFLLAYFKEKQSAEMEMHLTTFISHYEQYQNFIDENTGRDQFMCVETSRILFLKHFYNNLKFLSRYFDIDWGIPSLNNYLKRSKEMFGDACEMYELQIHEAVAELEKKLVPILLKLREHITEEERSYWMVKDLTVFNLMFNVKDNGEMPYY